MWHNMDEVKNAFQLLHDLMFGTKHSQKYIGKENNKIHTKKPRHFASMQDKSLAVTEPFENESFCL